jgi:hypothetical protein
MAINIIMIQDETLCPQVASIGCGHMEGYKTKPTTVMLPTGGRAIPLYLCPGCFERLFIQVMRLKIGGYSELPCQNDLTGQRQSMRTFE